MPRPYFLRRRALLGEMSRLAYKNVRDMMAAAVEIPNARPRRIGVIQAFSSSLRRNPHIESIASRGVWAPRGEWIPGPASMSTEPSTSSDTSSSDCSGTERSFRRTASNPGFHGAFITEPDASRKTLHRGDNIAAEPKAAPPVSSN